MRLKRQRKFNLIKRSSSESNIIAQNDRILIVTNDFHLLTFCNFGFWNKETSILITLSCRRSQIDNKFWIKHHRKNWWNWISIQQKHMLKPTPSSCLFLYQKAKNVGIFRFVLKFQNLFIQRSWDPVYLRLSKISYRSNISLNKEKIVHLGIIQAFAKAELNFENELSHYFWKID